MFRAFSFRTQFTVIVRKFAKPSEHSVLNIKNRLQAAGVTVFPNNINSVLWNDIKRVVNPPLTIQEMIILQNDLFSPKVQG